ncbi:MAG: response regulator [Deltaproteobacteria bacterium]|nr:response regulator [Deltaproteobacteria bacterium]
MSPAAQSPEQEAFARYLSTRKILIADPSAAARSGIFKVFQELGAKSAQITLVNTYKQAQEQIEQVKPHIVIAEYELGRRCGLDLLQNQRQAQPTETKETLFIVVTGNTSQSAVARAAEEDIDAYILKPFTVEVVRKTIMKATLMKIRPPEYVVQIEKGKALLAEANLDEAEAAFQQATTLDPQPSLACYYLGQVKYLRQIVEEAKGSYSKGLEFNKIHYKCLVGLYELLVGQKLHSDAYEIVKRISQYFPANPKRLAEVLRLAIVNGKYEDVEKYYAIFCNIDDRDETLIKYICAALVVCGRYYLSAKFKTRALELFTKAAATGTGRVKILKEIVQALLDFDMTKEAAQFLAKFPPESQSSDEYLLMSFKVLNTTGNRSQIIEKGRELIQKGLQDEQLYAIMIQRSLEARLTGAAETLYYQAIEKFPHRKKDFEQMVATMYET